MLTHMIEGNDPIISKLQKELDDGQNFVSGIILNEELEFENGVAIVSAEIYKDEVGQTAFGVVNKKGDYLIPLDVLHANIEFDKNGIIVVSKRTYNEKFEDYVSILRHAYVLKDSEVIFAGEYSITKSKNLAHGIGI